jgi:predicted PolB exonuclease-like 3'-5' exonuclease
MDNLKHTDLLFIDIETVPQYPNYNDVPDIEKNLWAKKAQYLMHQIDTVESIYQKAGIYAEFGKIICISTAYLTLKNSAYQLHVKSFYDDDEKTVLQNFTSYLNKIHKEKKQLALCAHNGKEFDYPYIIRRLLINALNVPALLNLAGKKPWEITHQDTLEMWKFGDYKNYTSLELLAHVFGIKTSKDDIDGSKVAEVYYVEKNLKRIVEYCQKDVATLVQLYLKMKGDLGFDADEINYL